MRVLVCGGRNFNKKKLIFSTLDAVRWQYGIDCIIHGGATGADYWSGIWGCRAAVPVEVFSADWKKYGRAAGPIRNRHMLNEGKPDIVVAFPGGKGTANMVQRARDRIIQVLEVSIDG
jgi:hypothetical protein